MVIRLASLLLSAQLGLPMSAARTAPPEPVLAQVVAARGVVTPEVREAFLAESERRVVAELASVGVRLTPAQLDVARRDPEARLACFGAIWPPDPRILLNLLEVREQVGPELYASHRRFLIAGAVARRHVGVGEDVLGEKEEWALRPRAEAEERGEPRRWPRYVFFPIQAEVSEKRADKGKEPRAAVQRKREERAEERRSKEAGEQGLALAAGFLRSEGRTPAQVMASPELRRGMLAAMGPHAPKAGVVTHDLMMDVMTAAGMRPEERDPFPSLADFCRYLARAETRFPVREAPWPLLMPLAKGWPIREAQDIQARVAKGGKPPTYGKYQGKELVLRARLEPSPWHWNSWQGTYQAGGVCHEMSTIGVGTYVSLGVPATKTGQPHHSCVTVFSRSDKGYSVQIKQGTRGPVDTKTQWLFADPRVERPLAYHMGLALAMNVGLGEYVDTRIAVHLADMLQARGRTAEADLVLSAAAARNPNNTEVWVALREMTPPGENALVRRARLLRLLCELGRGDDAAVAAFRERPVDISLEAEEDDDGPDNPAAWTATYVSTVARQFLLPGIEPGSDPEANRLALDHLSACRGKGVPGLAGVVARFEVALEGWQSQRDPVLRLARAYLEKPQPAQAEEAAARLRAAADRCPDRAALLAWLGELERLCDDRMTAKNRPRGRNVHGDPLYREVSGLLSEQLEKAGRVAEAEALRSKLAKAVEDRSAK